MRGRGVDGTGSGSCAVVELVSAVLQLCVLLPENSFVNKMDFMEIICEDRRWLELAEDRVNWWALVLAVLNICVLLPES
jgi:hypothetical protein